jgi:hypothetical protein
LKGVVEPAPTVKNAAAHDQAVEKDRSGNDDKTQAESILKIQRLAPDDPFLF